MADPKHTYGTLIKVGDGGTPEVFTTIPKIFDFGDSPVGEPGKLEVTNADSTGFTKQYIDDWTEPSEITIQCYWDSGNAVQAAIIVDSEASPRTVRNYQKVYSNGSKRTWPAYPVVKEGADLKGALVLSIKLVGTGASTLT